MAGFPLGSKVKGVCVSPANAALGQVTCQTVTFWVDLNVVLLLAQ